MPFYISVASLTTNELLLLCIVWGRIKTLSLPLFNHMLWTHFLSFRICPLLAALHNSHFTIIRKLVIIENACTTLWFQKPQQRDAPARGSPTPRCGMAVGGGSSPHMGVRLPSGTALWALRHTGHYFVSPLISSLFYRRDEFAITLKKRKACNMKTKLFL